MAAFPTWNNQPYQHRYISRDGGPPNRGFAPGDPRGNPIMNRPFFPQQFPPPYPAMPAIPGPSLYRCFGPCCGPTQCLPIPAPVPFPQASWIGNNAPPGPQMPPAPPFAPQRPATNDPTYPPGANIDGQGVRFADGSGFIFPELCCMIHLIEKGVRPWENPGGSFKWRAFKVPIRMKLNELMRGIGIRQGVRAETMDLDLGICEVIEMGDGRWSKGSEYKFMDSGSDQTLEEVGWSEKRGAPGGARPVWLCHLTK